MGPVQTLEEFLGLLWRRRLLIAAVTVALSVVVVLVVLSRPVVYQATAVIQVESPTITDGSGAVVAGSSAQRIQTIQQRLTTRDAMLAVIERHGLYTDLPLTNDEKVHLLRMAVSFVPVASAAQGGYGGGQQVSALIINAQADTAEKAARIANDFAQGVLDASAQNQSTRTREALAFFQEEEASLSASVDALEAEIADFRNANADSLPELRESRRAEVAGLEAEIRQLDQTLVELQSERARIGQGRTLRGSDQQQVDALTAQEAVLTGQRAQLVARRDALDAALARAPEVERMLSAMQRRLDQLRAELADVSRRKVEAATVQKLEERQQTERFTLLERAVTPEYPISGGRRKLAAAGAFASLIAGIAAAFVMDLLHPALRTRTQFERELAMRPVVVIPDMGPPRRRSRLPGRPARPGAAPSGAGLPRLRRLLNALPEMPRPVIGALAAVVVLIVAVAVA